MRGEVKIVFLVVLALTVVSLTFSQQTTQRIHYVNKNDRTCGGHTPCHLTIQAAVNAAQPGDTVRIQAGQYDEAIIIKGKNNSSKASETDRIIIEADPAASLGTVVLRGARAGCTNGQAVLLQ